MFSGFRYMATVGAGLILNLSAVSAEAGEPVTPKLANENRQVMLDYIATMANDFEQANGRERTFEAALRHPGSGCSGGAPITVKIDPPAFQQVNGRWVGTYTSRTTPAVEYGIYRCLQNPSTGNDISMTITAPCNVDSPVALNFRRDERPTAQKLSVLNKDEAKNQKNNPGYTTPAYLTKPALHDVIIVRTPRDISQPEHSDLSVAVLQPDHLQSVPGDITPVLEAFLARHRDACKIRQGGANPQKEEKGQKSGKTGTWGPNGGYRRFAK